VIRTSIAGISQMGRYTQGVRLIHIREDDEVSTVAKVAANADSQDGQESSGQNGDATENGE